MQRTHWVIIGLPGSGKSTLARRLALELKLPHVEADVLAAEGTESLREQVDRLLTEAAARGWVYEGLLRKTEDLVLPKADVLIWIQEKPGRCFARLLKREVRGLRSWPDLSRSGGRIVFFLRNWKTSLAYYERLCAAFDGETISVPNGRDFSLGAHIRFK